MPLFRSVLEPVRRAFPLAAVFARVFDRRQLLALRALELEGMVREVWESAIKMGRMALEQLGTAPELIDRIEAEYRRRDEEMLALQSVSGDLHSGQEMMFHQSGPFEPMPVDIAAEEQK